ncbi:MAG: hypothetical protein K8W52_28825 [Deltaproteobacteria bacterium]|nr:hypothetical protein [Deltaproteobacteria bacterium]
MARARQPSPTDGPPPPIALRPIAHPHGSVALASVDTPDAWWSLREAHELPPGALRAIDRPYRGSRGLRASPPPVLPTGDFQRALVVRAPIAALFDGIDGIARRPIELHDAKGLIAADYVLLEITARAPLDRAHSTATWEQGWLAALTAARWPADRITPRAFRLLERPEHLFVDPALANALLAAAPKHLVVDDLTTPSGQLYPPNWSRSDLRPLDGPATAEAAYWALAAGDRQARAQAIAHPWWAFAVARCLDRGPADDTRAAVLASPELAAWYATEVDAIARPDTRAAAIASGPAALWYMTHLELALPDDARAAIVATGGHDDTTVPALVTELAALRAHLRGETPLTSTPAPRIWPAHDRPRYAAASRRRKAPRHSALDAALRRDIDAFIARGHARLALAHDAAPELVVAAIHAYIAELQSGARKPTGKPLAMRMELGCAWGEQLHRALGWQWAHVHADGAEPAIALISPDAAIAHLPFALITAQAARRARQNTCLLLFNMLADGQTPPSKPGDYVAVQ